METDAFYSINGEYKLSSVAENLTAEAGYTNAGLNMLAGTSSTRLYFGLDYGFDMK